MTESVFTTIFEPKMVEAVKLDSWEVDIDNVLPIILENVNVEPDMFTTWSVLPDIDENNEEKVVNVLAVMVENISFTEIKLDTFNTFIDKELPIMVDAWILDAVNEDANNVELFNVE